MTPEHRDFLILKGEGIRRGYHQDWCVHRFQEIHHMKPPSAWLRMAPVDDLWRLTELLKAYTEHSRQHRWAELDERNRRNLAEDWLENERYE